MAARLNLDGELPNNKVYSIALAYGGGQIMHNGQLFELPAYPSILSQGLQDSPDDVFLVSTSRPSVDCVENPLSIAVDTTYGVTFQELFDAFVYFKQLTPATAEW